MNRRHAILAALVAFLLVNIVPLGTRPAASPDETRYGSIALQMAESGDWLHLRMSGFRYYEKPALGYWMMAAAIDCFGANDFAIRLPAALCGGLAALAAGLAARQGERLAGSSPERASVTGSLVALCSLTMVLPAVGSSVANLDSPIAGFVIAASACFFIGATSPPGRVRLAWLAAAGVAAGLGLMTKGLLAFAFPAVTVVPWLLWERRWRDAIVLPIVPIAVALAITAPWALAVHRAEPGFWERFIIHEHLRRFAGTAVEQPHGSWSLYLMIVPLGCVPWILNAPAVMPRWPSLARASTGVRFAICAVAGPLLFLSASSGKLPTYSLPLFPPIAWLIVRGLLAAPDRTGRPAAVSFVPGAILVGLGVAALALALGGDLSAPILSRIWLDAPHARAGLLAAAFIAWGLGDWQSHRVTTASARVAWLGLSPVVPLALFGLLIPLAAIPDLDFPGRSLEEERATIEASPSLLCDYKMAHACAWELQRPDFLLVGDVREFENGLGVPEEEARRIPDGDLPATIATARARGAVAMAVEDSRVDTLLVLPGMPTPSSRRPHRGWTLVTFDESPALEGTQRR